MEIVIFIISTLLVLPSFIADLITIVKIIKQAIKKK